MYNEYKKGVWLFTVTPLFYINCLKRSKRAVIALPSSVATTPSAFRSSQ